MWHFEKFSNNVPEEVNIRIFFSLNLWLFIVPIKVDKDMIIKCLASKNWAWDRLLYLKTNKSKVVKWWILQKVCTIEKVYRAKLARSMCCGQTANTTIFEEVLIRLIFVLPKTNAGSTWLMWQYRKSSNVGPITEQNEPRIQTRTNWADLSPINFFPLALVQPKIRFKIGSTK